jgi:hypothetical protein
MEGFTTKQEEKLYRALQVLLHNSVDNTGRLKKVTPIQFMKASKALHNYEKYARVYRDRFKYEKEVIKTIMRFKKPKSKK